METKAELDRVLQGLVDKGLATRVGDGYMLSPGLTIVEKATPDMERDARELARLLFDIYQRRNKSGALSEVAARKASIKPTRFC